MTHNPKNQKVFQNTFKPKFKTKLKKFMENKKYKMSYWQLLFRSMIILRFRMTKNQKYFLEKEQMDKSLPEQEIYCSKKHLFQQNINKCFLFKKFKMNKLLLIKIMAPIEI